jgi:hypothetical protein
VFLDHPHSSNSTTSIPPPTRSSRPGESNGKTSGFDVMKGYQSTAKIDNEYYSCTLYQDKNIIFDLGSVLVALFC